MIDTGHSRANAALALQLDLFERLCGPLGYAFSITYESTPAVFSLSQEQLDASSPFAWPHHYRVVVEHDLGCWKSKVVDSVVHDPIGAIRALVEGVELGVSDAALGDWMKVRISS